MSHVTEDQCQFLEMYYESAKEISKSDYYSKHKRDKITVLTAEAMVGYKAEAVLFVFFNFAKICYTTIDNESVQPHLQHTVNQWPVQHG